ncbi:hypothetical protein C2S53_000406 [Perilla frutescens var. hirtella]|uniref:Uncharacterized protein n=1 Tax=Perilla frutescens var. hirtella TaxID=608512 RepID=A0AAD4JQ40_PERFH|nr:hypothetical protein C2S53_000406 [Perilla frutescens var. hirtella]
MGSNCDGGVAHGVARAVFSSMSRSAPALHTASNIFVAGKRLQIPFNLVSGWNRNHISHSLEFELISSSSQTLVNMRQGRLCRWHSSTLEAWHVKSCTRWGDRMGEMKRNSEQTRKLQP